MYLCLRSLIYPAEHPTDVNGVGKRLFLSHQVSSAVELTVVASTPCQTDTIARVCLFCGR